MNMYRRIVGLLLVCLVSGVLVAQDVKELLILHTNDMHSRIEPFPDYFPDSVLAGKAGMVRRATFICREREKHSFFHLSIIMKLKLITSFLKQSISTAFLE